MSGAPNVDLLRALFDELDVGILIADDEGRYVEVNARACRLLARSRAELVGMTVFELVGDARDEAVRPQWAAFLRDGMQSGIFEVARPDGGTARLQFNARTNLLPGMHCSFLTDAAAVEADETERGDGPLTMCAWTKRIKQGDRWIGLEEYLLAEYGLKITHGICPDALDRLT